MNISFQPIQAITRTMSADAAVKSVSTEPVEVRLSAAHNVSLLVEAMV